MRQKKERKVPFKEEQRLRDTSCHKRLQYQAAAECCGARWYSGLCSCCSSCAWRSRRTLLTPGPSGDSVKWVHYICSWLTFNRAFQYVGPVIWNSLPLPVRPVSSFSSLKSELKTYLFSSTYMGRRGDRGGTGRERGKRGGERTRTRTRKLYFPRIVV